MQIRRALPPLEVLLFTPSSPVPLKKIPFSTCGASLKLSWNYLVQFPEACFALFMSDLNQNARLSMESTGSTDETLQQLKIRNTV